MEKQSSLTIIGILLKSLKTTFKNGKLVLSIMLFVFFSLSLLQLCVDFVDFERNPVLKQVSYESSKLSTHQYDDFKHSPLLKDSSFEPSKRSTHQYNDFKHNPLQKDLSYEPSRLPALRYNDFEHNPLLKDLSYEPSKYSTHQYNFLSDFDESTTKDIKILLVIKLGTLVIICATLLVFSIATISSSSAAYTAKTLTLNDMVMWARRKWTAAFMTTIYMSLLSVAFFIVFIISLGFGSILTQGFGSSVFKIGTCVLLGIVCYIYLSVVWVVSLVVSVVEDKCSGLKAIDKANEILKGKWIKACVIMVLFTTVSNAVYMLSFVVLGKLGTGYWAQFGVQISTLWSFLLVKFFLFVVYTVFYHECKNSEKDEEGEGKLGLYLPVASGDV